MKFFDRLFPFTSTEVFYENLITSFWVIILIAIFLFAGFYLLVKFFSIKKSIEKTNLQRHKKIGNLWKAYESSFSSYGEVKKTRVFSDEFFNEHNILIPSMNIGLINNVSNILIGLGILGTFVGLTYGISDSNFETTEAIKSSINNLLSGMGTAFVTSIWGMGLSLLFTFVFKIWHSHFSRIIQNLCLALDNEYKVEEEHYEIAQEEKQRRIINELFNEYLVADTDQGKQLPKNVFRQLLEEAEKQTKSLQSFSDDLGSSIELAMQKLVEDNSQQISKLIEEKLVPVLEDLKAIKQDSGTKLIEDAVQKLADSMKLMMDDFKNTITGDTKQEMEELSRRLIVVSDSLSSIPNSMTDITLQVTEVIESLKDTVIKNIEQSKIEASEINRQNRDTFKSATHEYQSTVEGIQENMEVLLATQKDNINQVSELNNQLRTTIAENTLMNEQFESMIQKSRSVIQLIESISNKFEMNSTSLSLTSANLKESTSQLGSSINDYVDRNNQLLNHQQDTMQKTKDISEIYATRFETIENGLSGIFDQIQMGLKDYQKTTAENLNQYLKEFSSALTKAHQGLESSVSRLNDYTEELADQIEKLSNKK